MISSTLYFLLIQLNYHFPYPLFKSDWFVGEGIGAWIGCNWLGAGRSDGCFEHGNENFNFRKMRISWLPEKL